MKIFAFFAKKVLFGILLLALLAASCALLLLTLAFLYRPTTLDVGLVIWHILLNGGNFTLLLVVLIAGICLSTRRRATEYAGASAPSSVAITLLGLSLISTIVVSAMLAFGDFADLSLKKWLDILNLTDVSASGTVIAMTILSYHIPLSSPFSNKINITILRVGQCVIIVCLVIAVIMLPTVAKAVNDAAGGPADDYIAGLIPVMWVNLTSLTGVIVLLNWQNSSFGLVATGTAAAIMTFAASCCYTLLLPDLEPPVGGQYAIVATAIPLLFSLAILLRRYRLRSRNRP